MFRGNKVKELELECAELRSELEGFQRQKFVDHRHFVDEELRLRAVVAGMKAQVRPQTEDRFAPMRKEELLSAFAVADDEPLLEALVHVLHAMEIERGDNAAESDLPAEVAKGYAMAQGALKEAQEEVLRWVDEANRARSGGGDAG